MEKYFNFTDDSSESGRPDLRFETSEINKLYKCSPKIDMYFTAEDKMDLFCLTFALPFPSVIPACSSSLFSSQYLVMNLAFLA